MCQLFPRSFHHRRYHLESCGGLSVLPNQSRVDMVRVWTLSESRISVQGSRPLEPCRKHRHHHSPHTNNNETSNALAAPSALVSGLCGRPCVCHKDSLDVSQRETNTCCRPCVAVIARLIPTTPPEVFQSDLTWWLVTMQNWSAVEYGSGMICASLILLKPLIKIVFPNILGRSAHELKDGAIVPCPKQAKRAQSEKTASHQTNKHGCMTAPKETGHALPEKALKTVTDQPRPIWYLGGLQSPHLEAYYDKDAFSSQSTVNHDPRSGASYGPTVLEINLSHAGF